MVAVLGGESLSAVGAPRPKRGAVACASKAPKIKLLITTNTKLPGIGKKVGLGLIPRPTIGPATGAVSAVGTGRFAAAGVYLIKPVVALNIVHTLN